MYALGLGVLQDYKYAFKWYMLAARQGHANAQKSLGNSYTFGEGVVQDYIYAHMWLNIANANGADAFKDKELVEEKMTPAQIERAQTLARECVKKEYKDC